MYEMWQLLAAYFVGTAGGIMIFRQQIKENIVASALDALVENDYLRTYVDNDGITQLYKWYENDLEEEELTDMERIERMSAEEIEEILDELIKEEKRRNGK